MEYEKDQVIELPEQLKDLIAGFIEMRKALTVAAFADIAVAFGLGAEAAKEDQTWKLMLDREQWTAALADTASEKEEFSSEELPLYPGTEAISIDKIVGPVAKLEVQGALKPLVVKLIHISFQDLQDYIWALNVEDMSIVIEGKRVTMEEAILDEGLESLGISPDEGAN
jgi:hypothetical protein